MELTEEERKDYLRVQNRQRQAKFKREKKVTVKDSKVTQKDSKGKSKARLRGMNDDFIDDE